LQLTNKNISKGNISRKGQKTIDIVE